MLDSLKIPFPITPELGVFGMLATIAALAAVGVVYFRDTVRSALCLVLNFFMLAFIYFSLNAEMLGITQIVVYTGAIMVLFLFVIMLLNLGTLQVKETFDAKKYVGIFMGVGLAALLSFQMVLPLASITEHRAPDNYGAPESIGRVLMTQYVLPFEIAGILLLLGAVGSVLLAKRKF